MTAEQENLLRRHYADTRTDRLAAALGVSYRTVCRWAASLGLKKHEDFRQGFSAINGSRERDWSHRPKGEGAKLSAEVTEYLRRHYATTDNRVLAARFHVNARTIRRWAGKLALRKDNDWLNMHRAARRGMTPEQRFQLVATIGELYPDGLHDEELVRRTGYCFGYIQMIARQYNIRRSEDCIRRHQQKIGEINKRLAAEGKLKRDKTRQLEAVVQREYATTDNDELARRLGISIAYVKLMARRLGLKKTREYRSKQLRRPRKNRKSQNNNEKT